MNIFVIEKKNYYDSPYQLVILFNYLIKTQNLN